MNPLAGQMYDPGQRIAPPPGYDFGPGLPPQLQPMRSPAPGMAPGMTPQVTPESWTFLPQASADRIIRVPNLLAVTAGTIGTPQGINWPDDGYVLWWTCEPRAIGTLDMWVNAMSALAVQIQAGDQGTYITGNGNSSDYVQFRAILNQPLLYRAVARQETWTLTVRNYASDPETETWVPEITFGFKSLRSC